jgi:hypothetical protein
LNLVSDDSREAALEETGDVILATMEPTDG